MKYIHLYNLYLQKKYISISYEGNEICQAGVKYVQTQISIFFKNQILANTIRQNTNENTAQSIHIQICVTILGLRHHGQQFPDDIFKFIFFNENHMFKRSGDNKLILVQIMARYWTGYNYNTGHYLWWSSLLTHNASLGLTMLVQNTDILLWCNPSPQETQWSLSKYNIILVYKYNTQPDSNGGTVV